MLTITYQYSYNHAAMRAFDLYNYFMNT